MKQLILFFATIICISIMAQDSTRHLPQPYKLTQKVVIDTPAYQKDSHFPVFSLLLTDSTHYTNLNIPKNKPTIIVYFSPECSHCQGDAKRIAEKLDSLKDVNFIWSSSHEVDKIKEFAIKYKLAGLSNMVFGKDLKYAIPSYYKIQFTPYFVIYSKDGLFFKEFRDGVAPSDLITAIEKLKKKKKKTK